MSISDARPVAAPVAVRNAPDVHSPRWYLYVVAVIAMAAAFLVLLVYLQVNWAVLPSFSPLRTLFLLLVGILAHRFRLRVGDRSWISASFLADFLAATILGPLPGALVAAGDVASSHQRGLRVRTAFDCAAWTIVGGATGIVFWGTLRWLNPAVPLSPTIGLPLGQTEITLLVAGLFAGVAYQALNYALYAPLSWLRRGLSPREWFDEGFRPYLPFHFFFLVLSLGLVYAFAESPPLFVFLFLPVIGLIYAFRAYSRQRELASSLERFSLQIAASMLTALDLKDNYTAQHSAAVAQYSYDTARWMHLNDRQCNLAHLAGLLHDLGKISVPDEVLNKRETLEQEDWDLIQGHSKAGQTILSNMNEFEELGQVVLHHHEHYDGMGYPYGLSGEEIPLLSRIVSVADAYSAMTSNRPYRSRRRPEVAMAELDRRKGTQFDPTVVDSFIAMLEAEADDYRNGVHIDFEVQFQKVRFLRDLA